VGFQAKRFQHIIKLVFFRGYGLPLRNLQPSSDSLSLPDACGINLSQKKLKTATVPARHIPSPKA